MAGTVIGQRISHFRVIEPLGAGGMGVVYRAHDDQLDRDIALKLLPAEVVEDNSARLRLLREARAASALSHPHICHVYEAGEADGHVYIAMELVEGRTLSKIIPPGGLPLETTLRYAGQIAEALAHAHEKGVIHRDLKTDNVMITPEGRAIVLDFGLAKRLLTEEEGSPQQPIDTLTASGVVVGTPQYLTPEVLQGEKATAQSDLWTLGVVLFTMVSGDLPFQGRSMGELCGSIMRDSPAALSERVPAGLRAIIQRCLAKEPSQRYRTASEVRAALEALQGNTRGIARPEGANRGHVWLLSAGIGVVAAISLLVFDVGHWRERWASGPPTLRITSLAVLPLVNLSGDPAQEYFADGMTDELIADLATLKSLKVISRTSAMRYKGTSKRLPEVARELGVDGIVEGSVLRSGERVRIRVELIGAAGDRHLWAQSYDRDLRDILALQSEVGGDIAERIHAALSGGAAAGKVDSRPIDPGAYEFYLRGRYYWNKRTQESLVSALDCFNRAIQIDSSYADAYAGLADTYVLMGLYAGRSPRESYPPARAAALKALHIDERLAEAHASLGRVMLFYDWNWTGAETEFKKAIELKPSLSTAHHWYSICLRDLGRLDDAIAEARRAKELDPVSLIINTNLGDTFFYARRYDEAITQHRRTLELDPDFAPAHLYLGRALEQKRMFDEALAEFTKARSLSGKGTYALGDLAHVYAVAGRRGDAQKLLSELLSLESASLEPDISLVHVGLGDRDRAFEHLEKAFQERSALNDIKVDPRFDPLRDDPRFQDLLRRLKI